MRATIALAALALVATLGLPTGAASASGAAQADLGAFCQARLDLGQAIARQDDDGVGRAAAALFAAAPPEVQEASQALADVVARKGHQGIGSKKGTKAAKAIDAYVVRSCGLPADDVTAIDYDYQGLPDVLAPGGHVFVLTNDAPKETHELVLAKVRPGVRLSPKKLVALSGRQAAQKLEPAGAAVTDPGDRATLVVSLTPGRYVYACFVPVGGRPSQQEHGEHGGPRAEAKPHWRNGMLGSFEVTATP